MNVLKGNLTYIVAGVTALWAIVGLILGQLDATQVSALLLAALGTFGVRRAIG